MKPLGFVLRVLVGLVCGFLAAGILFGLATIVAGTDPNAGGLGLLALGFGLAFFPTVFVAGTRSPRHVIRRGLVVMALEGLGLVAAAYLRLSGTVLLRRADLSWVQTIEGIGESVAQTTPIVAGIAGGLAFFLGLLLALLLRPAARPAPARAGAPAGSLPQAASAAGKAPAAKPAVPPKALPDEDAQLATDLANLQQKLKNLPK